MTASRKHLIIPDTQHKPGLNDDHFEWIGKYIVEKKPDVVIHLGDHWDMPSLSSYDRGRRSHENRRYRDDIDAGNRAIARLLRPLDAENARLRRLKRAPYKPELHYLIGNHEERIERYANDHAELTGTIGYKDFHLPGFKVHGYLEPVEIDGILYSHYFYNPKTGKPWTGNAHNIGQKVGRSCVMGHRQGLDFGYIPRPTREDVCIVAGSCYRHDEAYRGPQASNHWNGILMLHDVGDETDAPSVMSVKLSYLKRRYEK